jgi:hypothetical protein
MWQPAERDPRSVRGPIRLVLFARDAIDLTSIPSIGISDEEMD